MKDVSADEEITAKELEDIEVVLEEIADQKKLNIEKNELQDLKEEVAEYHEVCFQSQSSHTCNINNN